MNEIPANELSRTVEAILFGAGHPLSIKKISQLTGAGQSGVKSAVESLRIFYQKSNRAFYLDNIAGGFQLRTDPIYSTLISDSGRVKIRKFSQAALETLSIIAYKQPVTRSVIEHYRTVDSGYALKSLLEKELVRIIKRDTGQPGCPILYGTSDYFLEVFGFDSLANLPSPDALNLPFDDETEDRTDTTTGALDADTLVPTDGTALIADTVKRSDEPVDFPVRPSSDTTDEAPIKI